MRATLPSMPQITMAWCPYKLYVFIVTRQNRDLLDAPYYSFFLNLAPKNNHFCILPKNIVPK